MRVPSSSQQTAFIRLHDHGAFLAGAWIVTGIGEVERTLTEAPLAGEGDFTIDLTGVTVMDTAGALMVHLLRRRLLRAGRAVHVQGPGGEAETLLALVSHHAAPQVEPVRAQRSGLIEEIGRVTVGVAEQGVAFLSFMGRIAVVAAQALRRPRHLRWTTVLHYLDVAGYRALPIVGLLAFLVGMVIAYQGGVQLRQYGANVFIADLVGISMLRELGPLLTAVIIAGRTGSAFTAQIGTMKVNEEIDALRTMGVEPIELLVVPKVVALMIALPLLTVYADALGLLGGMVIADVSLGLSPAVFIDRLGESLTLNAYLTGLGKAPIFAAVIAAIGCFQGFRVEGGAESVGRQTTVSVVQSIFLVIVLDAIFSVLFSYFDV